MIHGWMTRARAVLPGATPKGSRFAARLFTLFVGLAAVGCTALGDTRRSTWTEEVKLSTGEVIRIERWVDRKLVAEPFQRSGWLFQRAGFEARLPFVRAQALNWEGTLAPLALDVANGAVYFVGVASTTQAEREYRLRPSANHVAFVLEGAGWERIKLSELPPTLRPNLLANTYDYLAERRPLVDSLVTLEMKAKFDSVSDLAKALRVIPRE